MADKYVVGITAGLNELGEKDRAWHRRDKWIDNENLRVREAYVLAQMDQHKVSMREISYPDAQGNLVQSRKFGMLVREELPGVFETELELKAVTDQYTIVGMDEVVESIDGLSEFWPVRSACMLDEGAIALFSLQMKDHTFGIKGDQHLAFLTVANDFRGDGGLKYYMSLIRAVCWNTYSAGLASASYRVSIPHKGEAAARLKLEADVSKAMIESKIKAEDELNRWVQTFLTQSQIADVLEAAFPMPKAEPVPMQIKMDALNMATLPESSQTFAMGIQANQEYNRSKMDDRNKKHREAAAFKLAQMADEEPAVTVGPNGTRSAYSIYAAATYESNHYKGRGNTFGQLLPGGERDRMGNRALWAIRNIISNN